MAEPSRGTPVRLTCGLGSLINACRFMSQKRWCDIVAASLANRAIGSPTRSRRFTQAVFPCRFWKSNTSDSFKSGGSYSGMFSLWDERRTAMDPLPGRQVRSTHSSLIDKSHLRTPGTGLSYILFSDILASPCATLRCEGIQFNALFTQCLHSVIGAV